MSFGLMTKIYILLIPWILLLDIPGFNLVVLTIRPGLPRISGQWEPGLSSGFIENL